MEDGGGGRGVRAGCIRIRCPSPRRIISRLFNSHCHYKDKGKKTAMSESRVRHHDPVEIINRSDDGHVIGEFTDLPPQTVDLEMQRKEFLFSIGVSCYLLHLIATGREEIHKIIDLRNDIEKFLESKNHELRRKQVEFAELRNNIDKLLERHNNDEQPRRKQSEAEAVTSVYSTTSDVVVDGQESCTDNYYSPQFLETSLSIGKEGSLKHYVFKQGEMDRLEAELAAEFEILQLSHGQDKSECSQGLRFRHMCTSGQVLDHDDEQQQQQGVCPYELERRLHEVMEARQEEEIKELEITLEDAKRRLHVKESEATWWRETAYIVSEHVPEPSRITLTHLYPLSR
ncbi:unnamed protein product [Cochlearia groenlandica]